MALKPSDLKNLLLEVKLLTSEQFDLAEKEAKERDVPLEEYLVDGNFISDSHLGQVIADYFKLSFIDISQERITEEALSLIPEIVAKHQKAIVIREDGENLYIATSNPENYEFIKLLEKKTGKKVVIYYTTPYGIQEAVKYYKSNLSEEVKKIVIDLEENPQNEENIVKLVDLFLEYAFDNRASDIHIEPLEGIISVRFRIDGILHQVVDYPKLLQEKVVFRIKIMSRLRTDEHAAAQDGRFDYQVDDARFDVRVSILPVTEGENIVLRILSERTRRLNLDEIGLLESDLEKITRAASKPYGMILVAGPTGSGKTTTLYTILQILNKPEVNIMTIEDPVEYDIEHIRQTQVNAKKNLTFATGLRSIVRQDPNIIMVGEIRDNETASIAINAAMTGHLLFSSIHSNDAATTLPRLFDMGIEPFLVASSLNVVIAQRLVRKICQRCIMSYPLTKEEINILKSEERLSDIIRQVYKQKNISKIRLYKGAGCKACNSTGYSGRTGIFEVMEISDDLRPLIVQKVSIDSFNKKAQELGMTSMLYDGIVKIFRGTTTLKEVIRATKT